MGFSVFLNGKNVGYTKIPGTVPGGLNDRGSLCIILKSEGTIKTEAAAEVIREKKKEMTRETVMEEGFKLFTERGIE